MEYKGYIIELGKNISQHIIRHTGKGSLPKIMNGSFTSVGQAQKIVDKYIKSKEPK